MKYLGIAAILTVAVACGRPAPPWESANPVVPVPMAPLGSGIDLAALPDPPTPERVRLGRWLFYDTRLSADGSVSCATCHSPEHAFSQTTPVSAGIRGQKGSRKAPAVINHAGAIFPRFFWDGRAASLEEQALGPIANPIEMGGSHDTMVSTLSKVEGYAPYFREAFGTPDITKERVAKAIADYERTRMSGNSPWDRWRETGDAAAVSDAVKQGHDLFFGKAECNQCHLGNSFTDSQFHNLGVGWDPKTATFKDWGRWEFSKNTAAEQPGEADRGAFKTPTLREVTKHAPYMHDGSIATLREVVELYNRGGVKNPWLDPKIKPLKLTDAEIDALVEFMKALEGEGYQDAAPASFPQ
jgi:cytochrome c peroxidase